MNSSITRLGMVIILVPDVDAAVPFYQRLGLKLSFHLKSRWAELQIGEVKVGLCPATNATGVRTGIVLEVDDVHAFYEAKKEEIPFLCEPFEAVHGIMTTVTDPAGNMIDLYQPTPEKVRDLVSTVKASEADDQGCNSKSCCKTRSPEPEECCA